MRVEGKPEKKKGRGEEGGDEHIPSPTNQFNIQQLSLLINQQINNPIY